MATLLTFLGKGTQAAILSDRYGIRHLVGANLNYSNIVLLTWPNATGDMLRAEMGRKTDLGIRAQEITDAGQLVDDEIVVEMIRGALASDSSLCKG